MGDLKILLKIWSTVKRCKEKTFSKPLLKSDILTLDDLSIGTKLSGTARNTQFGAFVDIGLKQDAMIHISKNQGTILNH